MPSDKPQLEYEIEKLEEKVSLGFQEYEGTIPPEQQELTDTVNTSTILQTQISTDRYLSFIHSRQRCFNMHGMSRAELAQAELDFLEARKKAMENMKTIFENEGVI